MDNPKVSIGIAVWGAERFIRRAAESLFSQTYPDIEYVFVNDCTEDKSIEVLLNVLDKYPNRRNQVRIITHKKNSGLAVSRNTILDNISGEFLVMVDPDDWIDEDFVEKLIFEQLTSDADLVVGQIILHTNQGAEKKPLPVFNSISEYIEKTLKRQISVEGCGKLFRTSLLSGIHMVPGVNVGEDFQLNAQFLTRVDTIAICGGAAYHYNRENEHAMTYVRSEKSLVEELKSSLIIRDFYSAADGFSDYIPFIGKTVLHCASACLLYYANHPRSRVTYNIAVEAISSVDKGQRANMEFKRRLLCEFGLWGRFGQPFLVVYGWLVLHIKIALSRIGFIK